MVVLLGSPTPESAEVYARTVTEGDPSWVGPLAGRAILGSKPEDQGPERFAPPKRPGPCHPGPARPEP